MKTINLLHAEIPPTLTEYRDLVNEAARAGVQLQHDLAAAGHAEPLYLYARPSEPGKPGALRLIADSEPAPEGWQLVTPEPLRISIPYDAYFGWIFDRARNQPVMSID